MRSRLLIFLIFFCLISSLQGQTDASIYKNLIFRFIGPEGNRAIAIAGVPGDPMVTYIGAASGGLWKTTDGGINWDPIFDGQEVSSIGSIAISPSNPDIVWVEQEKLF